MSRLEAALLSDAPAVATPADAGDLGSFNMTFSPLHAAIYSRQSVPVAAAIEQESSEERRKIQASVSGVGVALSSLQYAVRQPTSQTTPFSEQLPCLGLIA